MRFIFLLLMWVLILFFMGVLGLVQHEKAHHAINVHNGCEDSEVYFTFAGGVTVCNGLDEVVTAEQNDRRRLLHGFNEIVSYNLWVLVSTIVLCSAMISFQLYFIKGWSK